MKVKHWLGMTRYEKMMFLLSVARGGSLKW